MGYILFFFPFLSTHLSDANRQKRSAMTAAQNSYFYRMLKKKKTKSGKNIVPLQVKTGFLLDELDDPELLSPAPWYLDEFVYTVTCKLFYYLTLENCSEE